MTSFPPSKEENVAVWSVFPLQDMPEVVKKKVSNNRRKTTNSSVVQCIGFLLHSDFPGTFHLICCDLV